MKFSRPIDRILQKVDFQTVLYNQLEQQMERLMIGYTANKLYHPLYHNNYDNMCWHVFCECVMITERDK